LIVTARCKTGSDRHRMIEFLQSKRTVNFVPKFLGKHRDCILMPCKANGVADLSVTLETVEDFMGKGRRTIAFPAALERRFEQDTQERRCARLRVGILVSAVLYNFFLIADWLLVPDVLRTATLLHLGLVTPWMLFAAWSMTKRPPPFVRECMAASVPLFIILQIDYGFASTTSESAAHYQYVVIPTLLYANVSLHRLPFRFARVVTAAVLICHAAVVLSANYISNPVAVMILVQLAICAYITLVANYTMERDLRRAYLFSLRDRLRHSLADAASKRDSLTGLANRHHLDIELRRLWAVDAEPPAIVSMILMDIDYFKRLNDRYGHGAGDLCLKRMASILTAELGAAAEGAVRYGGEEFLVVLPEMQLVDAMRIAERIRRSVEMATIPNEGHGLLGIVTASFGVASASVGELTAAELIAVADTALYAAKRKGRNQVWPPLATPSDTSNVEQISFRDRA
jgi:diguanylate cyclase (GGDEF)-like protein